jgi:hypothetical protein
MSNTTAVPLVLKILSSSAIFIYSMTLRRQKTPYRLQALLRQKTPYRLQALLRQKTPCRLQALLRQKTPCRLQAFLRQMTPYRLVALGSEEGSVRNYFIPEKPLAVILYPNR